MNVKSVIKNILGKKDKPVINHSYGIAIVDGVVTKEINMLLIECKSLGIQFETWIDYPFPTYKKRQDYVISVNSGDDLAKVITLYNDIQNNYLRYKRKYKLSTYDL